MKTEGTILDYWTYLISDSSFPKTIVIQNQAITDYL